MNSEPATPVPAHHHFTHEAMMTTFSLRLCGEDESLMRSLACECIDMIDELERKLSRYHQGGDVARINAMEAGETLYISDECHRCLLTSMEATSYTQGLFDSTLGAQIEHRKSGEVGALPQPVGRLVVHPDTPSVTCETPGRIIDLGGIGKGFALDELGNFLLGWDLKGALLSSGASTHLAIGSYAWPIDLAGDTHQRCLRLEKEALSASGTDIQGCHIVSPYELAEPSDPPDLSNSKIYQSDRIGPHRIWACSPTAAYADAWSTALMSLPPEQLHLAPSADRMLTALYIEETDGFHCYT